MVILYVANLLVKRSPNMNTPISELGRMTEAEKMYRINERMEDYHASIYEWDKVIADKWYMLIHTGGSL